MKKELIEKSGVAVDMNEEVQPFYSNMVTISVTTWDFTMDFKWLHPRERRVDQQREETSIDKVRNLATVVMSPQHAKAFANLLMEHIGKYERQFGEISIQPSEKK